MLPVVKGVCFKRVVSICFLRRVLLHLRFEIPGSCPQPFPSGRPILSSGEWERWIAGWCRTFSSSSSQIQKVPSCSRLFIFSVSTQSCTSCTEICRCSAASSRVNQRLSFGSWFHPVEETAFFCAPFPVRIKFVYLFMPTGWEFPPSRTKLDKRILFRQDPLVIPRAKKVKNSPHICT